MAKSLLKTKGAGAEKKNTKRKGRGFSETKGLKIGGLEGRKKEVRGKKAP